MTGGDTSVERSTARDREPPRNEGVTMYRESTGEAPLGRRVAQLALGAVLGVALLAGCGDDDSGDEPSAQEQYCEAGDSLESSVSALVDLDLVAEGTSGLESAVDAVKADLDELRSTASEAAAEEIDALEQSVDDLGTAASDLGGEISTENASALEAVYGTLTDCP
jgi:outer membrane murein-binding lipoprotein Lpp